LLSELKENMYRIVTGTPEAVELEMNKLAHEGYTFVSSTLCELPETPAQQAQAGICVIMTNLNAAMGMVSNMTQQMAESMKSTFNL
jgi:hypothetical protein